MPRTLKKADSLPQVYQQHKSGVGFAARVLLQPEKLQELPNNCEKQSECVKIKGYLQTRYFVLLDVAPNNVSRHLADACPNSGLDARPVTCNVGD